MASQPDILFAVCVWVRCVVLSLCQEDRQATCIAQIDGTDKREGKRGWPETSPINRMTGGLRGFILFDRNPWIPVNRWTIQDEWCRLFNCIRVWKRELIWSYCNNRSACSVIISSLLFAISLFTLWQLTFTCTTWPDASPADNDTLSFDPGSPNGCGLFLHRFPLLDGAYSMGETTKSSSLLQFERRSFTVLWI